MYIQEFLDKTDNRKEFLRHRIVCNDGSTVSIQGSHGHYCSPRDDFGPYDTVEAGFPSVKPPESWREYSEGKWSNWLTSAWENRYMIFYLIKNKRFSHAIHRYLNFKHNSTRTVYGYMPVELVNEFMDAHDGMNVEKTFEIGEE